MPSVDEMVIKWSMDNTKFNQGLTQMNKSMSVLKSEFSATSSKLKNFGSATDQLKNKQEYLTKSMDIQKQKIDALKQAYDKQVKATGENSKEAQNLAVKLNNQISYYNRLEGELKQTTSELDKQSDKWNKVSKSMENASKKIKNIGTKTTDVGKKLTLGVTTPIVGIGTAAFSMASDMDESINKVEVACGSGAEEVKNFSQTTLNQFGIAKGTALDMMATFSDMGTGMGLESAEANKMSMSLVGLAGDLSSFKNIRVDVAKTALNSIYTGETESLKQLGIVMTQANLQEYAHSQGINKKIQDMTQAEQVQLRYNYVMEKTKNAQGDFARTSEGAANQQRIFSESLKELGATIGENIVPVVTPIIKKINEIIKKFGELDSGTQKRIVRIAAFAAAVGPALVAIGKVTIAISSIVKVVSKASSAISKAGGIMAAITSPAGIAVIAITGIIVAGVLLWKNWDKIKEKCSQTWGAIKSKIEEHGGGIKGTMGFIGESMKEGWRLAWNAIDEKTGGALSTIKGKIEEHGGGIKGLWGAQWEAMNSMTGGKLDAMIDRVKGWGDNIKNFFSNLHFPEIKLPHVKLPHFNLTGEFSLKPPSVPRLNVDWYYQGGIFTRPTILGNGIGVGDAYKGMGNQAEAVIPLAQMYSNLRNIVREESSGSGQTVIYTTNIFQVDGKELRRDTTKEVLNTINRSANNYKRSKGGISFA